MSVAMNTYKNPKSLNNPTYRPTDKNLQSIKPMNTNSGFNQNSRPFDGKGFRPVKELHGIYLI